MRPALSSYFMAALLALAPATARADVVLVGVFPGRAAILAIDGGEPRTVRVGQKLGPVIVLAVEKDRAVIETDGKRKTLLIGQYTGTPGSSPAATLFSDARGHYVVQGSVNGAAVRFVLDTGATLVVLPAAEAQRIGIDYRRAPTSATQTANGQVTAWRVKLGSVKVGNIEINGVDAAVIETALDSVLLGMSFLSRVDMRRDGDNMTLVRRF